MVRHTPLLIGTAVIALLMSGCIDSGPYYKDCDAVHAASAAPIKAGEPGYRSGLDRNRDGVACEEG